ncbi:cellulase family glycosylhydrolase [Paludisphaera rhizosphaerae]|uniref:cellulase family glycosylhydrolase n=1 Tax=Paludisphaera rhizosphaerae TaxID=2711216 RepID=UPI0013EB3D03|nr:cellulase family glycosylhydrolase [Paludisphaera rhizosphaerae]
MKSVLPRIFLAAAAVLLIAAAPDRINLLPRPRIPDGFGVNIHFTDPKPGEMERFAEAGFKWVRMDLGWAGVEKQPGKYDFSAFDRLVGHLDKVGARAYFILDYGHPRYDGGLSPHTPEGRAAFAAYARAAAAHFKGRGVIWEIWNEPNISFWKPKPNADDYTKLANATVDALRGGDPDAFVMAPASSQFPWEFFETLFASGILEKLDAVSVHPYRESNPETAADDYGRLRAMIARYASPGRKMLPIISGEWGYSTAEKRFSEAEQARYIVREYLSNLANGVNLSIFYDWKDDGPDPKENEHRFGTVRQDLSPKPSFLAAKNLIQTLRGYEFRHRLKGESPSEWRLLFARPPMLLGTGPGPVVQPRESIAIVSWTTDPKASEASRTPSIRLVKPEDPDAESLEALATAALWTGPLVEQGRGAITAPDPSPRIYRPPIYAPHLTARVLGVHQFPLRLADPGGAPLTPPPSWVRSPSREFEVEIRYKDRPLPALAPFKIWRIDPLELAVAPRGQVYQATIKNPSKLPFEGRLVSLGPDRRELATVPVSIPEGESERKLTLPIESQDVNLSMRDSYETPVLEPILGRFEPIRGLDRSEVLDGVETILHVENKGQAGQPVKTTIEKSDGRDERVLKVDFQFDPGWRYLTVHPRKPLPIPENAREALLWIKGDGSNAYLRCRFTDKTGQTFQPDLGRLDFKGWRLVSIPLDGSAKGGRWGGADDGAIHRPLAWDSLLLLDSPDRNKGGAGSVVIASPSYRLDH